MQRDAHTGKKLEAQQLPKQAGSRCLCPNPTQWAHLVLPARDPQACTQKREHWSGEVGPSASLPRTRRATGASSLAFLGTTHGGCEEEKAFEKVLPNARHNHSYCISLPHVLFICKMAKACFCPSLGAIVRSKRENVHDKHFDTCQDLGKAPEAVAFHSCAALTSEPQLTSS